VSVDVLKDMHVEDAELFKDQGEQAQKDRQATVETYAMEYRHTTIHPLTAWKAGRCTLPAKLASTEGAVQIFRPQALVCYRLAECEEEMQKLEESCCKKHLLALLFRTIDIKQCFCLIS
jgi:hypothetical protein